MKQTNRLSTTSITTKTPNVLRVSASGDWHIGHRTTPTRELITAIYAMYPDNEKTAMLDIIVIDGDIYDHDLYLYSSDEEEFKYCKRYLLNLCAKYDITLMIVEGTPDHDWRQARSFITENELMNIGADVRYVDTVEIVYVEKFDMNFLFVPDAYRPTTAETWEIVQETLKRHNLEKVDFCIMHGCFPHQLPELDGKIQMHDSLKYSEITEYYVFIGHIHQSSQFKNILGPGSLGRLAHRDEGDKGHILVEVDLINREDKIYFNKNIFATPYITLDARRLGSDEVIQLIDNQLAKLKMFDTINLRILAHGNDPATLMYRNITKLYPHVRWALKSADDKKKVQQLVTALVDKRVELNKLSLSKENIPDILYERIKLKEPTLADGCIELLKEIINGIN